MESLVWSTFDEAESLPWSNSGLEMSTRSIISTQDMGLPNAIVLRVGGTGPIGNLWEGYIWRSFRRVW